MNKKLVIIILIAIVLISAISVNLSKTAENNNESKKIKTTENIPIKIEDIDYSIQKAKNDKGEIMIYLKVKNNSKKDISYLCVDVSDGENLDTAIEYVQKIKAGSTTDNYSDIKNSKDDRTKIPVKGNNGEYLHEIGSIKVKSVAYRCNDNGTEKSIIYDNENKMYTEESY
ncbi:hypothetical protein [Paraclostridium sordellii]|uniref:Uncharacterized protein n=1 Tax=Paraclostridium sordellii TaxID=1505 RepID=A0A9P1KYN7_PARSO|nr:hypothetical protein [Paeniclostridium sordellii]CEN31361.1 Uncharacterised protein [[Clostridium] sordellii] [Paeniclostridium sordellii]